MPSSSSPTPPRQRNLGSIRKGVLQQQTRMIVVFSSIVSTFYLLRAFCTKPCAPGRAERHCFAWYPYATLKLLHTTEEREPGLPGCDQQTTTFQQTTRTPRAFRCLLRAPVRRSSNLSPLLFCGWYLRDPRFTKRRTDERVRTVFAPNMSECMRAFVRAEKYGRKRTTIALTKGKDAASQPSSPHRDERSHWLRDTF